MWGRALDAVYPRTCAGCGEGAWPFCADCVRALRPLAPPWCRTMREPVRSCRCPRCRDCPPPPLDSARAAFVYDGPARRAIHRLKFSGLARCGGRDGRRDGRGGSAGRGGRGHVGAPRPRPACRAWVRPGAGARRRAGPPARPARQRDCCAAPWPPIAQARRSGRRAADGHARASSGPCERRRTGSCSSTTCSRPARPSRRPPRLCAPPARPRSTAGRRGPLAARAGARCAAAGAVGLSSGGLSFGSVVARGCSPVVDASRGRNDPRKATVGG